MSAHDIGFNPDQLNGLLGTDYSHADIQTVLERLGFQIQNGRAVVPSWRRHDVKEWPCLAEEVARIKGYDPIPADLSSRAVPQSRLTRLQLIARRSETFFVDQGFQQVQTFTMVSPDDFKSTKVPMPSEWLQIQNPLTPSESVLRRYLMASLLKTVEYNHKRQSTDLQLFEIGKVFYIDQAGSINENLVAGAIITGGRFLHPYTAEEKSVAAPHFLHLKGLFEELMDQLRVGGYTFEAPSYPQYHPTMSADVRLGDTIIGNVGFLHPDILANYDIRQPVGYIGISLTAVADKPYRVPEFTQFGRFPHTRRDIALLAPKTLGFNEIESTIDRLLPSDVRSYFLFDHFESEKIGTDQKSLAFGFIYQHDDRTLSDDDVNPVHDQFCAALTAALPISIR
jgi:phenylalanyl-tRNA synthetase beta chain